MKFLPFHLLCAALLLAGCTTTTAPQEKTKTHTRSPVGDGPATLVAQWVESLQSQNTDAVMQHFSDRFSNTEFGDKAGARATVEQARVLGYLNGIQADTSAMELTCDGNASVVGPVKLRGSFGEYTLNLRMAEENGAWKITGSDEVVAGQDMAQVTN